jgi:hypothetical protein
MQQNQTATKEQLTYAALLNKGMKLGLLMLVVSFLLYMSGVLVPHVPVDKLPEYWGLSVHKFLEVSNIHPGWTWVGMISKGDFLNFVGISFLAGVTILCYVRIIPILFGKGDKVFAVIGILEVLVLALAASGLLKTGGH